MGMVGSIISCCWVDEELSIQEQLVAKRHAIKDRLAEIAKEVDFRITMKQPMSAASKDFAPEIVKACEDLVKYHDYSLPVLQRDFNTWGFPFHMIATNLEPGEVARDPINPDMVCLYKLAVCVGSPHIPMPQDNDFRLLRTGFK